MGYVYFIAQCNKQGNNQVKIGYSKNPKNRLKSLATSSPLPLQLIGMIKGTMEVEKEIHLKFHKDHLQLEWFLLSNEILDFVNQNTITNTYCDFDYNGVLRVYKKIKK